MKEVIVVAAGVTGGGAKLGDAALGICLLLAVVILFVSTAAHFEAEKEYERKKAAGEVVPPKVGLSWVSFVSVLPANRKRAYFLFLGACFVAVFATLLIDRVTR